VYDKQFDPHLLAGADQIAAECRDFVRNNPDYEIIELCINWLEKLKKAQFDKDAPEIVLYEMAVIGLLKSRESAQAISNEEASK